MVSAETDVNSNEFLELAHHFTTRWSCQGNKDGETDVLTDEANRTITESKLCTAGVE